MLLNVTWTCRRQKLIPTTPIALTICQQTLLKVAIVARHCLTPRKCQAHMIAKQGGRTKRSTGAFKCVKSSTMPLKNAKLSTNTFENPARLSRCAGNEPISSPLPPGTLPAAVDSYTIETSTTDVFNR